MVSGDGPLWKIAMVGDEALAAALEALVGEEATSFSRFEASHNPAMPAKTWRIEALLVDQPDRAALAAALADMLGVAPAALPRIAVERLADVDWLALNRAQFPPVLAGRFFVHGSHFEGRPPAGKIALKLNAGPAFGSGTHETTKGCLIAIDELVAERPPRNALDLGCGSGILALAIAAAAGIDVIATDIDPVAAATTRENAEANGLGDRIKALVGAGVAVEEMGRDAPYDLIVANILAEPLIELAPEIAGLLAPDGRLMLSGLLTVQEPQVLAAYRAAGLTPGRTIVLGEWSTLVLGRGV
jgi:ribosomal protein L11 methyltransferase